MTLISYQEWYAAGHTRQELARALAAGAVRRVRRGVLTAAEETGSAAVEHRLRIRAAAPFLAPGTFFSHYSAAVLHGLPLLAGRLGEVTVVRTRGGHGTVLPSLHARAATLSEEERAEMEGLPVTSLTRTACDLARSLPFREAVMLLDPVLRLGIEPIALLAGTRRGRGCRMAERAILFADGRAESPGESLSRVVMLEAGLAMPVLQHPVVDGDGVFIGRGDFYWDHVRTVGEFDGRVKYAELAGTDDGLVDAILAEKRREQRMRDAGYDVVRWTWPELWDGSLARRLRPRVGFR